MGSLAEGFGRSFNWCDRRCERCPLALECPLALREAQTNWVLEARGEDPDDPEVAMRVVAETLQRTFEQLLQFARDEGIDLDAPLPQRPASLDAVRLQRLATHFAGRVRVLPLPEAHDELRTIALVLCMKCARIACHLEAEVSGDVWESDAVPNLLLVQRLLQGAGQALAQLAADHDELETSLRQDLEALERVVQPLLAQLGPTPARLLAGLISRDAAPSPFCITRTE
jgi:hypothetical protein